jgi:D-beta-D-heptose 7-phosphate kinase/D-beta-D-heptose 1-phosphate adenosyltransferase
MLNDASTLIDRFTKLRALVVGDVMLDSYLSGPSRRLCQEAPVPIVDIMQRADAPGGAANCAANVRQLGAECRIIGAVGDDCEADLLRTSLQEAGIDTQRLHTTSKRRTLHKARVYSDGHLVARLDQGTTTPVDECAEQALLRSLDESYAEADVVIVSDYSYGVLSPALIEHLARLQRMSPRVLVVDSKRLRSFRGVGMTLCKPNYYETLKLLNLLPTEECSRRWDVLKNQGERVLKATGSRIAAVTLDCEGALVFEGLGAPYRTYARAAPQKQAAGAGDTFLSSFGLALGAGAETPVAAEIAAAAAAVVVAKEHTATCSFAELKQRVAGEYWARSDLATLLQQLDEHRRHNRRIVLTNGCFDLLHRGHITYLEQAKQLGDVLVVGVNTDESIRRLKGPSRPINCLADRMGVLAAISSVDHVVPFGEDMPHRLIEAVRPDVFVKGGDYTRATLPEAELVERLGGSVKILPFVADRSTTGMITRICRAYSTSADQINHIAQGIDDDQRVLGESPAAAVH